MSDRPDPRTVQSDGDLSPDENASPLARPMSPDNLSAQMVAAGAPVPARQMQLPGLAFGVSMMSTTAESEVLKHLTAEHISQEMTHTHAQAMRSLDLQEKAIGDDREERVREHERDQRDRNELRGSDGRLERMFYVVFGSVVLLSAALILKDKGDVALKMLGVLAGLLVTLAGGVGVEKLRQDRSARRTRPRLGGGPSGGPPAER